MKKKKKSNSIIQGSIDIKNEIYPSYVNLQNPKFIEVDNLYYSGLIAVDYYREQNDLILKNLIETNIDMNISMFYEKQDTYKMIKRINIPYRKCRRRNKGI